MPNADAAELASDPLMTALCLWMRKHPSFPTTLGNIESRLLAGELKTIQLKGNGEHHTFRHRRSFAVAHDVRDLAAGKK